MIGATDEEAFTLLEAEGLPIFSTSNLDAMAVRGARHARDMPMASVVYLEWDMEVSDGSCHGYVCVGPEQQHRARQRCLPQLLHHRDAASARVSGRGL